MRGGGGADRHVPTVEHRGGLLERAVFRRNDVYLEHMGKYIFIQAWKDKGVDTQK
jgi:hypothetical protein